MREAMHFFAGGNTEKGFFTCFTNILREPEQKRMFYIKGGPGVGKSSLMKRVGAAMEAAGHAVEYYHCSSDPDCLDGVSVPALSMAMMDGTAPHVYDPVIPGARDTLLSLGDFLDEEAMRPHMPKIRELQTEISARFTRTYRYLAAAGQVYRAATHGEEKAERVATLCQELTEKYLPLRGGRGTLRTLYGTAYTPKGFLSLLSTLPGDTTLTIECPFGQHADGLLRALGESALSRGLHVVALLNPLDPSQWSHLAIPAHGLLFTTQEKPESPTVEASRFMELKEITDKEQSFDKNAYELFIQRAVEQLKAAKDLHDELEAYYVSNMDFLEWEGVLRKVTEEFLEEA